MLSRETYFLFDGFFSVCKAWIWKKFESLEKENFESLEKENFDSLEREILTVWKRQFWQFGKGNLRLGSPGPKSPKARKHETITWLLTYPCNILIRPKKDYGQHKISYHELTEGCKKWSISPHIFHPNVLREKKNQRQKRNNRFTYKNYDVIKLYSQIVKQD